MASQTTQLYGHNLSTLPINQWKNNAVKLTAVWALCIISVQCACYIKHCSHYHATHVQLYHNAQDNIIRWLLTINLTNNW